MATAYLKILLQGFGIAFAIFVAILGLWILATIVREALEPPAKR